jgi:hypothetical protein
LQHLEVLIPIEECEEAVGVWDVPSRIECYHRVVVVASSRSRRQIVVVRCGVGCDQRGDVHRLLNRREAVWAPLSRVHAVRSCRANQSGDLCRLARCLTIEQRSSGIIEERATCAVADVVWRKRDGIHT